MALMLGNDYKIEVADDPKLMLISHRFGLHLADENVNFWTKSAEWS